MSIQLASTASSSRGIKPFPLDGVPDPVFAISSSDPLNAWSKYRSGLLTVRRSSDNDQRAFNYLEVGNGDLVEWVNEGYEAFFNNRAFFNDSRVELTFPTLQDGKSLEFTCLGEGTIRNLFGGNSGSFAGIRVNSSTYGFRIISGGDVADFGGGTLFNNSNFVNVKLDRDGDDYSLFLNDTFIATRTIVPFKDEILNTIGATQSGANTWRGVISDVKINDVMVAQGHGITSSDWGGGNVVNLQNYIGQNNQGFAVSVSDQSGENNNATQSTASNQPLIVKNGELLDGIEFDGIDDCLELGSVFGHLPQDTPITVLAKVKRFSDDATGTIFAIGEGGATGETRGFRFSLRSDSNPSRVLLSAQSNTESTSQQFSRDFNMSVDELATVGWSREWFYKEGETGTDTWTGAFPSNQEIDTTRPSYVGASQGFSGPRNLFHGIIEWVVFWDKQLTPEQAKAVIKGL